MSQLQSPMTFIITKRAARYGLLLGTALLNISWTFGHVYPDSYTYLRIAGYFLGEGEVTGLLVFRPLVPFLASLLSPVFGLEGGILGTLRAWSSPPAGLRHPWEASLYGFLGIDPAVVPTHLMVALRFVVSISAAFHGALVLIAGRWRDSLVFFRNLRIWPLLVGTAAALVSRPFVERRLAFILFPVILLLAAAHLTKLATKGMLVVFALFVVGSYSIVLLFPGLLWWS